MTSAYIYSSLSSLKSIRLIILEPAVFFEDALECRLIEVQFDNSSGFEALSYTWNDEALSQPVYHLNNENEAKSMILVTPNCEQALRHLRRKFKTRTLWIDAICIDQKNIIERNQQVKVMSDIYQTALEVIVWLGKSSEELDVAFRSLVRSLRTYRTFKMLQQERAALHTLSAMLSWYRFKENHGTKKTSVTQLFTISWFTRMWTIQEVFMARQCVVVCGKNQIPWSSIEGPFTELQKHWDSETPLNPVFEGGSKRYFGFARTRRSDDQGLHLGSNIAMRQLSSQQTPASLWNIDQRQTFFNIVASLKLRQCWDPRDKVFAMYSVYHAMGIQLPDPDYSKPVATVFQEAVMAMIKASKSFDILYLGGYGLGDPRLGLPSWVIDWTNWKSLHPYHDIATIRASVMATKTSEPQFRFIVNGSHLVVKGLTLDSLKMTVVPAKEYDILKDLDFHWETSAFRNQGNLVDGILRIRTLKQWIGNAFLRRVEREAGYTAIWDSLTRKPTTNKSVVRDWLDIILGRARCCKPPSRVHIDSDCYFLFTSQKIYRTSSPNDKTVLTDEERVELKLSIEETFAAQLGCPKEHIPRALRPLTTVPEFHIYMHLLRHPGLHHIEEYIQFCTQNYQLAQTIGARVGQVPKICQPGDIIALVSGLAFPVALRPQGSVFWYIGPVYISGVMIGEMWPEESSLLRDIVLV